MGEGRTSSSRVSVYQAAEVMGVTVDAIRKRISRDTIPHERDDGGRVWVLLDIDQDTASKVQDTDRPQSDSEALISEMVEELRDEVHYLRDQLNQELERRSAEAERYQQIVAALTTANASLSERLRELEPAQGTSEAPEERGSPETVREASDRAEPHPTTAGSHSEAEGTRRPWWRRMFGS